ncbi:hypothetical protein D3C78_1426370 [compost metagenome]
MRKHIIVNRSWFDHTWPANKSRNSVTSFPVGCFLSTERSYTTIRPGHYFGPIICCVNYDSVFSDSQIIQFFQQFTYIIIMFSHTISLKAKTGFPIILRAQVSKHVHAG